MKRLKMILISFCFILIFTGIILSCETDTGPMGLMLENKATKEYRFTGNFVMVERAFDTIIQPDESFNYDHSESSWYGEFEVSVYDINDSSTALRKTTVSIPIQTEKEAVYLSWDGTYFHR
jgi:hypothetical protein